MFVITKVPLSFSLPLCLSSSAMYRVSFSNKGLVNFCPSQERHELQKSSDKINFLKIKTVYDTKTKLHQWVLINTTKCPESDGLISALSLLFVEAATLYSSSSSEKSGPDFPRFYFTSPRIEMEIPGGGAATCFPRAWCWPVVRVSGSFYHFLQSKKLRSMLITRMEKFLSSDAIGKNIKNKFLIINKHKFVMTWVIIIFFLLCAQVGFIRYIMKIFKLNTSDLHLLLQKADTWAYTKCGASMSGTQLLENFNYLPTLYISFEPLSLKYVPKCERQGGKKYSPIVKSHPHRERGLLNYLVSQDSSSSMGRVIYL